MSGSVESECDALVAGLFGASAIVRLGRKGKRTPNTQGVPDRLYFVGSWMLWFECKSAHDYLSPAQELFLLRVLRCGGFAGCGGRRELEALLTVPVSGLVENRGREQIAQYRTRQGRTP